MWVDERVGWRVEVGMWNVEFASGVRSVATGGWSVHGVDCNVCSVWFSLVVFSLLNVKCNAGRFVPNVRCGVCSVKCRVCSLNAVDCSVCSAMRGMCIWEHQVCSVCFVASVCFAPLHTIIYHYIPLQTITLHYITLHCITLHYMTYIHTYKKTKIQLYTYTYT